MDRYPNVVRVKQKTQNTDQQVKSVYLAVAKTNKDNTPKLASNSRTTRLKVQIDDPIDATRIGRWKKVIRIAGRRVINENSWRGEQPGLPPWLHMAPRIVAQSVVTSDRKTVK